MEETCIEKKSKKGRRMAGNVRIACRRCVRAPYDKLRG